MALGNNYVLVASLVPMAFDCLLEPNALVSLWCINSIVAVRQEKSMGKVDKARKSIFTPKRDKSVRLKKAVKHDVGKGAFGGSSHFK